MRTIVDIAAVVVIACVLALSDTRSGSPPGEQAPRTASERERSERPATRRAAEREKIRDIAELAETIERQLDERRR